MPDEPDPYVVIDSVLMPWAKRHGLEVETIDREWVVRSIWIYRRDGNPRAQMWFDLPDESGNVTIFAAFMDHHSPTKWGRREERHASLDTLEESLEDLFAWVLRLGRPGPSSV